MTSRTLADEARDEIYENGFFRIDDPGIGSSLKEMQTRELSFDFSTEAGFNFWRDHVLLNSRVQDIISALESDAGSRYVLAHRGSLAQDPSHIYTLRVHGNGPDTLIVQLWPEGSKVTYYCGSQRHRPQYLPRSPNGLWEVGEVQLEEAGCKAKEMSFEVGGLVIFDARVSFKREHKRSCFYTYVESSLLERWRNIGEWGLRPPPSQDLDDVARLGVDVRQE